LGSADIRIFVCDSDDIKSQNAVKDMITSSLGENKFVSSNIIVLFNKIDMLASTADRGSLSFDLNISHSNVRYHQISCVTGEGLNELEKYLIQSVHDIIYGTDNSTDRNSGLADRLNGITRQRHRNHIEKCIQHLHRFLGRSVSDDLMDVLDDRFMDAKAEELR
jgi:tRNA U34 5-carboxymethylaminomethyl modifying GTPase MnmE/TrmE